MSDSHCVSQLGFGDLVHAADMRRLDTAAEEDADLEVVLFRANEEVARGAGEHDRAAGGVDALVAEAGRAFAEALPGVAEILG